MYVEGMTITQAREWERTLQSDLNDTPLTAARKEQAQMDLQDVQAHVANLSTR